VVFTPEDLALSGGEPAGRRAFLDLSVSQIKLSYASVLSRYNKILAQRNAFLKAANSQTNHGVHSPHADHSEHLGQADIDIWDTQLAGAGAFLSVYRNVYIKNLSHTAGQIYSELTGGRETLSLSYRSSIYKTDHITDIPDTVEGADPAFVLRRMREHLNDDRRAGTTLVGVHRDDLLIAVGGKPVREYGSQGQQRSAALAIKLAQARILSHERDEAPVILLDDVLSELDVGRRSYILRHLSGFQTLITACEDVLPGKSHSGKFHVRGGGIL
jgi:DNA replication and repair protein RecF